ncbi:helix-turn-helix domain-containing protein [Marinilabilia rubra]|uniref:DNA-binding protein n=1 Tax=Marinilabilia rubra TaxID=2162893 RepID=A0A2U2BBY5_9BACT|nr:helix-turn-helix domain-containing protein [Marinilabilia rubra]PWE00585.1 DNA-binding protein [Marinilabilia rubra]
MSIEIVTKDELLLLKEDLIAEIRSILEENMKTIPDGKKWLRSAEVKELLSISSGTLQNLRVNGTLPFTRINGVIYYNKEDINAILEENMIRYNSP